MKPFKNTRGFTTAELLIAMAVLIILAAFAIPYFIGNMPRHRLNGAARQVVSGLRWCRMQSVSSNHLHTMSFLGNDTYKIVDITTDTLKKQVNIQDEYPDVTLASNANPTFTGRGTASPAASITLTNSSGAKQILVSTTGRISLN